MPEYEFQVLCADDDVCKSIMEDMKKDFTHVDKKHPMNGDHKGVITLNDIVEAEKKLDQLFETHQQKIRSITIVPK